MLWLQRSKALWWGSNQVVKMFLPSLRLILWLSRRRSSAQANTHLFLRWSLSPLSQNLRYHHSQQKLKIQTPQLFLMIELNMHGFKVGTLNWWVLNSAADLRWLLEIALTVNFRCCCAYCLGFRIPACSNNCIWFVLIMFFLTKFSTITHLLFNYNELISIRKDCIEPYVFSA